MTEQNTYIVKLKDAYKPAQKPKDDEDSKEYGWRDDYFKR